MNNHYILIVLVTLALFIAVINMGFTIYFYNNNTSSGITNFALNNKL